MKIFKTTIVIFVLMFVSQTMCAQEDYEFYLQRARQRLAEGDCTRAEACYNTYKDVTNKTNTEIERLIDECKKSGSNSVVLESHSGTGIADGHEYVDLGLPSGTLWATCNMGASKPEGYGNYYAWGETSTKNFYDWDTYKNHYWTRNQMTLQSGDDPATSWGSGWRTPSNEQWDELLKHTTNKWTEQNGVKGRLFTAKNGETLFLPAAGYRFKNELRDSGSRGDYWSQALFTGDLYAASTLYFSLGDCRMDNHNRCLGFSVRPVLNKKCITSKKETRTSITISGDPNEVIRAAENFLNDNNW